MHNKKPFWGSTKKLIDRIPFLDGKKFVELWEFNNYVLGIRIRHKTKEIIKEIRSDDITLSNNSFDFLKNSNEFLNLLINNINICILLLNKNTRLVAFNDPIKTIFINKEDDELVYKRCGEAIGCAFQVEEQKDCGTTSKCEECELRTAVLHTIRTKEKIKYELVVRPFFNTQNQKVMKSLMFSTHYFDYYNDSFVIMFIEDISDIRENE